ncbi:RNA polymerase sigma factor [Actinophytocola sediminis]
MVDPEPVRRRPVHDAPAGPAPAPVWAAEYERFYRETVKRLVGFLVLQGAQVTDAADVAQETLCKAFQRWPNLDNPRAWSFTVASRSLIRRLVDNEDLIDPTDLAEPTPSTPTPLLRANPTDAWHVRHDLITALSELPFRQRQVMAWRLSGYTPEEIATELQLTSDAVRSSLYLARRALAARLRGGAEAT